MNFGALVREQRTSRGLSLREVAAQAQVDPAYLSRVEAGKSPPSEHLIERLADVLECRADVLALSAGRLPASVKAALERQPSVAAETLSRLTGEIVSEPNGAYLRPVGRGRKKKPLAKTNGNTGPLRLFGEQESQTVVDDRPTSAVEVPTSVEGRGDPRNKLNALTAKEWIPETVSVWMQRGLGAGHPDAQIERQHPAPFSFTDVSRLIRFFTKPGETVLDPFVGVGSTLKACALEGRKGIGIELNKHYASLAKKRLTGEVRDAFATTDDQEIIVGDARDVQSDLQSESVDFVVTSPPYWNILRKEDHKAKQERKQHNLATNYGNDPRDLGNIHEYSRFLEELAKILGESARLLRPKRYMALIVSDFRDKSKFIMFHSDLATALAVRGLGIRGITILYQRHKKIFPYGYPYGFVPNIHHQYILILQKES